MSVIVERFKRGIMSTTIVGLTLLAATLPGRAETVATAAQAAPVPPPAGTAAQPALPAAPETERAVSHEFDDKLSAWADQLDEAARKLETKSEKAITRIGDGETLKLWSIGERVDRLSTRLIELGLLSPKKRASEFNDAIDEAVRRFQKEQGMRPDGLVGLGTRAALDRDNARKAAAMRASATAMRDLRDERLPDMVLVNLPTQTVRLVRDGRLSLVMPAVVGRPERETPLLRDEVTHVIVNPTWTVPPTVLREDKMPKLRDTGAPGINNAVVYLDGRPVTPGGIDWRNVTPGRVRIVQQPGDDNALGRFRFNLTNDDNIYLHGTNDPRAFNREIRTVSSGCVRLFDARKMAEALLNPEGVSSERIDKMLERGTPQWVKLSAPIPVRFTYWTATVDDTSKVRLHPDIYGVEEKPVRPAVPADVAPAAPVDPAPVKPAGTPAPA